MSLVGKVIIIANLQIAVAVYPISRDPVDGEGTPVFHGQGTGVVNACGGVVSDGALIVCGPRAHNVHFDVLQTQIALIGGIAEDNHCSRTGVVVVLWDGTA